MPSAPTRASVGFGGSCFQKDILNLVYLCEHFNLPEVAAYWEGVVKMNDWQKSRFVNRIVKTLFNTVTEKKIAILGFAFKKDTNDTRESAAIYICRDLLMEKARLTVYDPKVDEATMRSELAYVGVPTAILDQYLTVVEDPYAACDQAHALASLTEWDEFKALDFARIHQSMFKPAFVFDGRNILDAAKLGDLGFDVYSIGKGK